MYVTRPLSLLRRSPELVNMMPREGPNSGYLVLFDEECETTTCFGLLKDRSIRGLPFPQNKDLITHYSTGVGKNRRTYYNEVIFVPAVNQPLSSNLYYVIQRHGKHKGEASVCSKEEDMGTFCCCNYIRDAKPKPLDPSDPYQHLQIIPRNPRSGFSAASTAQDGFPPAFLRRRHWKLSLRSSRRYQLGLAPGLDAALRAKLPALGSEAVRVGKWYVPFMFVTEPRSTPRKQLGESAFYEVTLEQQWESIFRSCEGGGRVEVDVVVEREEARVEGREAVCEWGGGGVTWYVGGGGERVVGVSDVVAERVRWEQGRGGFGVGESERSVRVKRSEVYAGKGGEWRRFECFVLVERFVFRRMDGSVLLTHQFNHTHHINCLWE